MTTRGSTVRALRLVPSGETHGAEAPVAPASTFDDSELLAAVRRGDEGAARELHDRVRPRVDLTILRLFGRRDVDHEDLVQHTLIEIVYGIDRFRGECALDTWTSRIAAHVVYHHLRRRRLERRVFEREPTEEEMPVSSPSHERAVAARDVLTRIRGHLARIDEAKAWTFLLHDVCGYDLREISVITEVSVDAAQKRLVRGRRELHARLAADPDLAGWVESEGGEP
jgi:RNA polymerase sigma-70 factor (ECF subfamily)